MAPLPAGVFSTLKRLILEFRHRLSTYFMERLPAEPAAEAQRAAAMVEFLDRTRRGLGRVMHAMLFLYQKLRTLVPTELHDAMEDPAGKLVPLPFYILPYKAQHALRQGAVAVVQSAYGAPRPPQCPRVPLDCPDDVRGFGDPRLARWLAEHVAELEELLPLHANSAVEVPHFAARLLKVRLEATRAAGREAWQGAAMPREAHLQDRLDVLLLDALTVYMSAWRSAGSQPKPRLSKGGARRPKSPSSCAKALAKAPPAPDLTLALPPPDRELRLGPHASRVARS